MFHRRLRLPVGIVSGLLCASTGWAAALSEPLLVGGVNEARARVSARTDAAAAVSIEYATTSTFEGSVTTAATSTTADRDFTAILELDGLEPDTRYYYRAIVDGVTYDTTPIHSFVTFPAPGAEREFSFAVLADLENTRMYPDLPAPAYAAAAAHQPAFVLQIGDFDHSFSEHLVVMRSMHRRVRGPLSQAGEDFALWIASAYPLFHVWDDHDFGINNADKTFENKADALQAFDEYYPTPDRPSSQGIWHRFRYAQAEFFMLDVRSQRDPVGEPDGPDKSMLDGDNIPGGQFDWLVAGLRDSDATWKIVCSGVAFNPSTKPPDSWGGWPDERQALLDAIESEGITGVVILSGDLHSAGAFDDGTNAGVPELSVPHTNVSPPGDCSGDCGVWSHGLDPGNLGGGYALVQVFADHLLLETRAEDGTLRRSFTVEAEADSGRFTGTTFDPSGAPEPESTVTVRDAATRDVVTRVSSDGAGLYLTPELPLGQYLLAVRKDGFVWDGEAGALGRPGEVVAIDLTLRGTLVSESFEGPGYESGERWVEIVDPGSQLDPDSTNVLPPTGGGAEVLEAVSVDSDHDSAHATFEAPAKEVNYVTGHVLIDGGLEDRRLAHTLGLMQGFAVVAEVRIQNEQGQYSLRLRYYSGGTLTDSAPIAVDAGRFYRIDYLYDVAANLWHFRVDGVTVDSGSLSTPTRTPDQLWAGIINQSGNTAVTVYNDLVEWRDAE